MKTIIFIVLRRHHRYLLVRRGQYHCFHAVVVKDGETIPEAIDRGYKEIALVYVPKVKIADRQGQFEFGGERVNAMFAIVDCLHAVPSVQSGASFDLELSRPDVFVEFFDGKSVVTNAA